MQGDMPCACPASCVLRPAFARGARVARRRSGSRSLVTCVGRGLRCAPGQFVESRRGSRWGIRVSSPHRIIPRPALASSVRRSTLTLTRQARFDDGAGRHPQPQPHHGLRSAHQQTFNSCAARSHPTEHLSLHPSRPLKRSDYPLPEPMRSSCFLSARSRRGTHRSQ
jgi:hypothetical protein